MQRPHTGLSTTEQLMLITVRLEVESPQGVMLGTGFVMTLNLNGSNIVDYPFYVVVTNRHVVTGATKITMTLHLQASGQLSGSERFEIVDPKLWVVEHPDPDIDLAVIALLPIVGVIISSGKIPFFISATKNDIATAAELEQLAPGMKVTMIGYPDGLYDRTNNRPIFRSGITATHPGLKYNGKDEFVIDCACYHGSSGSPVWLVAVGCYTDKYGNERHGVSFSKLLGVLYAGPLVDVHGHISVQNVPVAAVATTRVTMNLGHIIRAPRVLDFEAVLSAELHRMLTQSYQSIKPEDLKAYMERKRIPHTQIGGITESP